MGGSVSSTCPDRANGTAFCPGRCTEAGGCEPFGSFHKEDAWLPTPDGIRLCCRIFWPAPPETATGKKWPVAIEMLPYRLRDQFAERDRRVFEALVRHEVVLVRVDVRGTGASEGDLPKREYSAEELADLRFVVAHFAAQPWSIGKVALIGQSWSANNSLMLAMAGTPGLGCALVVNATHDLFGADVRYPDGIGHMDEYAVQIDADNALPPNPLDLCTASHSSFAEYLHGRFASEPWSHTYLQHPCRTDEFWSDANLATAGNRQVPLLMVTGLLDGYRDAPFALLDAERDKQPLPPLYVIVGPWGHDWAHSLSASAPHLDFGRLAAAWLWHSLAGKPLHRRFPFFAEDFEHDPAHSVWLFVRETPCSAEKQAVIPGEKPIGVGFAEETGNVGVSCTNGIWVGCSANRALDALARNPSTAGPGGPASKRFAISDGKSLLPANEFVASVGQQAVRLPVWVHGPLWWWGDVVFWDSVSPINEVDRDCGVFTSPPLQTPLRLIGQPSVTASVHTAGSPVVRVVAILEAVSADGTVSLVTGGAIQKRATEKSGSTSVFIPMRFTSHTFPAGSRLRLWLCGDLFPMFFPIRPAPTGLTLQFEDFGAALLNLPDISAIPIMKSRCDLPDLSAQDWSWTRSVEEMEKGASVTYTRKASYSYMTEDGQNWSVNEIHSETTEGSTWSFFNRIEHDINAPLEDGPERQLQLQTQQYAAWYKESVRLAFERRLYVNGQEYFHAVNDSLTPWCYE
eukprot:TRINITY_DN9359_c0_g1_i1.p1 TRINITY_DN9359_c0_g1~~TRINITY_DN9359_c0_g1_i1.p1  ORF type:complete len:742 (-),score=66.26 TRINITY_DN9359_c0_g1_i1:40-2265(-)